MNEFMLLGLYWEQGKNLDLWTNFIKHSDEESS